MTIGELIERLQSMDPSLTVVKRRSEGSGRFSYSSMDGWWPAFVELVTDEHPLNAGVYFEPERGDDRPRFDALEL